jgi:hypothetical protein
MIKIANIKGIAFKQTSSSGGKYIWKPLNKTQQKFVLKTIKKALDDISVRYEVR